MIEWPDRAAITGIEEEMRAAFVSGDDSALEVLGYGEVSSVLALHTSHGSFALKRLPPMASAAAADTFAELFDDYLSALSACGIEPVPSRLEAIEDAGDEHFVLYCIQTMLPAASLGPTVFAASDAAGRRNLTARIVDAVVGCVDASVGLDGQLSNWAFDSGRLRYLDVTTPLLRDDENRDRLDVDVFLASLPWVMRGVVRRFMLRGIIDRYHDARSVLLDFVANLFKEGFADEIPGQLELVNAQVEPAIDLAEVRAYYKRDARTWMLLQRLRRLDRGWQRHIRRRPYPFLLPGQIER